MACAIWSLGLLESSKEKEELCPHFKHKNSLWIHAYYNVANELRGGGCAIPTQVVLHTDLCVETQKAIYYKAPFCSGEGATFVASLRACSKYKDLYNGTRLHDDILKRGLLKHCSDALVTMYAKCGELAKAKDLLDMYKSRDVFSWTSIIAGYARHGQSQDALNIFERMQCEGVSPNAVTFACILKACSSLKNVEKGRQIHDEISRQGLLGNDVVLGTALVDMYAKCGAIAKAQHVLEELPSRDVVSWGALIAGYTQLNQGEQALKCFDQMQSEGLSPDAVTFACILKACGSLKAAEKGKQIHDEIVRLGILGKDVVLGNALVDMYAKCGALARAQRVLEELPSRNVVSWNALIAGYAQQGQGEQALNCFEQMKREGLSPDAVTYACILKACGSIKASEKGKQVHEEIARQGLLGSNIFLGTALMDMYAKCGALAKAQCVFEDLSSRDVVSWSALIAGYVQNGQNEQALNCFKRMQQEGLSPDAVIYGCILKACGTIGAVDKGEEMHDEIVNQGLLGNNIMLGTALVDMYAKCGSLAKAARVLEELPSRDIVSWNALIAGYAQHGEGEEALRCFKRMQYEGIPPDAMTFASILKACGSIKASEKGEKIHNEITEQGLLGNDVVLGNALVDMYVKCGALAKARHVHEELPSRDAASWNALIAGYAQEGEGENALNCFEQMQLEGLSPNIVTFACVLKACGILGAADKGAQIHDEIANKGLLGDESVLGSALVDMYARCGALTKAQQVFEKLSSPDVFSWNALIAGYTQQGQGEQALNCFERMQHEGFLPNEVTFSCVLNACCHLGLVEDGHRYFVNMSAKYGVEPDVEHYTCMVDLFGRAGHLEKAVRVIQEMPSSNYSAVWHALLGACGRWRDANVGRWAFDKAVQVNKCDGAAYVLMANVYAAAGMQEDAEIIEAMRMENKAWTNVGSGSWIDVSVKLARTCALEGVGDGHQESTFRTWD